MVGVVLAAASALIADYFSQAVLVGYITGVAVVLILGQLGKLLGVSSAEGAIPENMDVVGHLGSANGAAGPRGSRLVGPAGRRRPSASDCRVPSRS